MMVFSKGGRISKKLWKYADLKIAEVKSFKYLGFTFQSNGRHTKHIEDMAATGKRRVAEVWSLGERKFKNNFIVRMQMFKSLVVPAITYGAEITGWREWEDIERTQRRYLRWVLGLDRGTRKAVLMDETKTLPIYIETGAKAMRYEERIQNSPCQVLRECLKEVHSGIKSSWYDGRRLYCNRNGWSDTEINAAGRRGESLWGELWMRDIECFHQLNYNKVSLSHYSSLHTDRLAWYLQRGRNISLIARFRCGNEERGRSSWRGDRSCRICGLEDETLLHIKETCCQDPRTVEQLLDERGYGEAWMRKIKTTHRNC